MFPTTSRSPDELHQRSLRRLLDRVDRAYEEGIKPTGTCRRCHEPTERPLDERNLCAICQDECNPTWEVKDTNRTMEFTKGPPHTIVAIVSPDLMDQSIFYGHIIHNPVEDQYYYLVMHSESAGNGYYGKNHPTKDEAIKDAKKRIIEEMVTEGDD